MFWSSSLRQERFGSKLYNKLIAPGISLVTNLQSCDVLMRWIAHCLMIVDLRYGRVYYFLCMRYHTATTQI